MDGRRRSERKHMAQGTELRAHLSSEALAKEEGTLVLRILGEGVEHGGMAKTASLKRTKS